MYVKETIISVLHTLFMFSLLFYENGVCLWLQFFPETSEPQNLINLSILSKKTVVLLKGEILRKFRCILLAKFTTFSLKCSSVGLFISSIEGVTLLFLKH